MPEQPKLITEYVSGGSCPFRLSKSRLFAFCLLVMVVSFCLALRLTSMGYLNYNPVCSQVRFRQQFIALGDVASYPAASSVSSPTSVPRERVRFPRTKRRLPQCIIIGVRKCGTRALLEFLNIHPSLQKASDEIHFFDDDSKYRLGLEWYRRRMPYSFPHQITIEKSPAYFITESVPERVRAMNNSVKLLLIVRDPVTRLISDYAQLAANRARKDRQLASFEDLVLFPDGSINTSYKAVRISMYSIYFDHWLEIFPREQVHIVDGDRLIVDPYSEVRRIEDFLGVPHRIRRDNFSYNRTKGFYCVRNDTVEKCLNDSKGRRHPEVSRQVVTKLRRFYSTYNRQFYRAVGRGFGWPDE